ncbi:hypothetical protein [Mesorhizobium sp.]|uniref:hypothetical protein n=1 Tax=Mesorhizobium sp. TaxID=1871066 RepID=UPI0025807BCA|nr:hypothetical protein [Mesorhizobium sp.]
MEGDVASWLGAYLGQRGIVALRFDALNRLWESVRESSHDFNRVAETFPNLDIEKVSKNLELAEKGAERGAANQPPKGAKSRDEVELAIIERIEEEKKSSHQMLEDQLQLYGERLTSLDFEGQFGMIRQANATSVSDFKAEIASGVDELHGLRRDLYDAEKERSGFRKRHGLDRAARVSGRSMLGLKVAIICFLLLLETALNGSFLAKGSEQGLLGGITEALSFSVLNIGIALIAAVFCVRRLSHRSFGFKLVGLFSLVVYLGLTGALNLALAHYREASGTLMTGAGAEVVRRLQESPFGLLELNSWILFGIGVLFSIVAFIDGWFLTDPYPGYAGVEKRLQTARNRYVTRKQDLIDDLRDIRDEHNAKVEEIIRALSQRRKEHDTIIYSRSRMLVLFEEHQNHLERTANTLLTAYREANRKARTEPVPKHFGESYRLQRIKPAQVPVGELNDRDLAADIRAAQEELTSQVQRIGADFADAVEQYHKLDKLFPENIDG